jgi:hypothetical protein
MVLGHHLLLQRAARPVPLMLRGGGHARDRDGRAMLRRGDGTDRRVPAPGEEDGETGGVEHGCARARCTASSGRENARAMVPLVVRRSGPVLTSLTVSGGGVGAIPRPSRVISGMLSAWVRPRSRATGARTSATVGMNMTITGSCCAWTSAPNSRNHAAGSQDPRWSSRS